MPATCSPGRCTSPWTTAPSSTSPPVTSSSSSPDTTPGSWATSPACSTTSGRRTTPTSACPAAERFGSVEQPVLRGEQAGEGPVRDADLHVDVLDVAAHGLAGDAQLVGDLLVREAAGQQPEHL